MTRCAHVPYAPTFSAPRELVLRFAHPYECPHSHIGLSAMRFQTVPYDILKSQIAPENTKNVAYTRKPHSMAAPIERPYRAAPIERPDRTAPTEHAPHKATKSNGPNRTPPIERPNRTLQSNAHNRAARSNGPKPNVPNRAAPTERPNPNRPPASQSRKKKINDLRIPQHSSFTAQLCAGKA